MSETPREFYVRAVVKRGELEVIMGLEFDPRMEHEGSLRAEMKALAGAEIDRTTATVIRYAGMELDTPIATTLSAAMGEAWPGRRYFLEVQHDDPDEGWVQVITPSGWPPKAPTQEGQGGVFKPGKPLPVPSHEPECASTILGGREDCSCPVGKEAR